MGEESRLRAVVTLAQGMAAAHTPRESWRAAALGACHALAGSFAALSVWERELGRLRQRDLAAKLVVGAVCPNCGRRVARLSDHLLGASPCLDVRPASRHPARRGPPAQRGRFLAQGWPSARTVRARH